MLCQKLKIICLMRLRYFRKIKIAILLISVCINACKKQKDPCVDSGNTNSLTPYFVQYPGYFPVMDIPNDNPLTLEGINLGRKLYYDTILSNTGKSCGSCHLAQEGFSSNASNSLPHVNLAWNKYYLWDGLIQGTLEDAMRYEVEDFFHTDLSKLNNSLPYKQGFKKVYKVDTIASTDVAKALSQFIRVMSSSGSLYDKYVQGQATYTQSQLNGYIIFTTEKGDCFHCHVPGLFTDGKFHNIGIDSVFYDENLGRFNVTYVAYDIGLFKTPSLRNIELTAPYMHDGRFLTLEEVVEHYSSGIKYSSTLDPLMSIPGREHGANLTPSEKLDLVAFLRTLTDSSFVNDPMLQAP